MFPEVNSTPRVHVARQGAGRLFADGRILGQSRHKRMPEIVPSVRQLSLFRAGMLPCALPRADRIGELHRVEMML